jgi:acetoin utilization protein AcuB
MREHGCRHLPVLDKGELVGMVSLRDLRFIDTLEDIDRDHVTVEEAMTPDPFAVSPDAPLAWVAEVMAGDKYGSAVVVEEGRVIGIFTTIDALRVLSALLRDGGYPGVRGGASA